MALTIKEMMEFVKENDIENQLYVSAIYLTKKKDITVRIQGTQSYTDLKSINIGYPAYIKVRSVEELLIFLKTHNGHESQHVLSSSISDMLAVVDRVEEEFSKREISRRATNEVARFILNSLEDGRIENILVNSRKGFLKYVKYTRYRFYTNYEIEGAEASELYDFLNSILVYATTGLLPIGFEKYKSKRLEEEFLNIKNYIDESIYAVTCEECMEIGYKIMMESIDYLETLMEKESDVDLDKLMQPGAFNTDEEQEFNTSHENSGRINDVGEGNSEEESGEDTEEIKKNSEGEENEGEENEGESNKDGGSKEVEEIGKDKEGHEDKSSLNKEEEGRGEVKNDTKTSEEERRDEAFKEIFKELKKDVEGDIEKGKKDKKRKDREKQKKDEFELTKEDLKEIKESSELSKEATKRLKIEKVSAPHHELPQTMKNKANKFNREIVEILYEKQKPIRRNQRRGMLDTRALYRFEAFDADDIFIKRGDSKEFNAIFYFLVDGSGSMRSDNKWVYAMETMAILEEGLRTIVETKIAVFKTDWYGNDDYPLHIVVKDYGEKKGVNSSYSAYKSKRVVAKGNNKDGVNIRIATKELEKRSESQKILFILSDGMPTGSCYTGDVAIRDVKEAVKEARSKGIEVIPIMFGDEYFRKRYFENYKKMYEKNIISTEPEKILSKTIRVLKNIFAS